MRALTDWPICKQFCSYEGIEDLRALQEVQDELVVAGVMQAPSDSALAAKARAKASKTKRKTRTSLGDSSKFRRFVTPSGKQVLVGRNNRQNDELSMKVANGACLRKPSDAKCTVGLEYLQSFLFVESKERFQEEVRSCY